MTKQWIQKFTEHWYFGATVQNITLNDRLQLKEQELKRGTEVLQKVCLRLRADRSNNRESRCDQEQRAAKPDRKLHRFGKAVDAEIQLRSAWPAFGIQRVSRRYERLTYKQHFDFDRFGNLYRKQANNQAAGQENPLPYTAIEDSDISKSTNRFTTQTTYDEAGQVVADNKFRGMGFGYDANGRMVKRPKQTNPMRFRFMMRPG